MGNFSKAILIASVALCLHISAFFSRYIVEK